MVRLLLRLQNGFRGKTRFSLFFKKVFFFFLMLTICKVLIEFVTVLLLCFFFFFFFYVLFWFFNWLQSVWDLGPPRWVHLVKSLPAKAGDARVSGSIPRSGRFPGGGNGNPLQYSCLEDSVDRGAWRATVSGVAKSRT